MDIETLKKSSSWAIQEALRILDKINWKTPEKGYVLFETGYGPSGLPHIGTFGEVVRTQMVMFAFSQLAPQIPTRIFCVSDDMDGMRKIPDNVPNPEKLKQYIGLPLTKVPDPFETHESYGHNMNARLRAFLDSFGFKYEFLSATECYKSGKFDEYLTKAAENYEAIMAIMLPTLGDERRETYSPFMPLDSDSGKVLAEGVIKVDAKSQTITYKCENGEEKTQKFTGGGCKLQWKPDFGMRWAALDVDYEIYGKDHLPNEEVYKNICRALKKEPPVTYFYELFLDSEGKKISKTKGNGISVEDWLKYAPTESLAYYMYQKPRTAKKLYFDVIPKSVDEYLSFASSYHRQSDEEKVNNPAFFIHSGDVPKHEFDLSFALLLNLTAACSPENDDIVWGFIAKYDSNLVKGKHKFLDKMVICAINYYNDFVKPTKNYKVPTKDDKKALLHLKNALIACSEHSAESFQNATYQSAKDLQIEAREFFKMLYQTLLGLDQGPRFGSFVSLFGLEKTVNLIDNIL
ncbi:lysine--tRNA ligase [Candidatus Deianiraea vastatrix]|uniref:Lysine--tRNA ligase n=1 Tax=Candidatus Deianiraea vastatrix TaxID=2163644 RepID=A0A5B8XDQ0_9RICK|nr:lysine--tRNA ligase [Candidatus Deianiraea vastatrix]QED23360.1 Lysine--tRNA ligase [Candidatus Deianiraea vastatrix]